jgi:hypothetical protein
VLVNRAVDLLGTLLPFASYPFLRLLEFVGLIAERGGALEILIVDSRFSVLVESLDLVVQLRQVGRTGHRHETDAGAGLVDDVDSLER